MWFRGSGINRDTRGHDTGQKEAQREPCAGAAAGEGNPRPPARDGAWGGAQRRAVHFLFGARRLPQRCAPWACVRAGRAPLSPLVPGTAARLGTEQRQAPLLPGPREPRQNFCSQPSPSPAAKRARVGASSFPPPSRPPSLSPAREDGPSSRLGLVYSAAEDYIYMQTASVSPEFPLRRGYRRLVFQIPVLHCTCLAGYLWESVGGAQRVESVASLCIRKKTLSPRWRPLPRVTRRETPEPGQPVALIGIS